MMLKQRTLVTDECLTFTGKIKCTVHDCHVYNTNSKLTEAFRPTKTATYQTASNILHINYALRQNRGW